MNSMLMITLTAVVVGYTSALTPCGIKMPLNFCKLPTLVLKNSKVTLNEGNCGQVFSAEDFSQLPTIQWSKAEEDSHYTVLFLGFYYEARYDFYWGVSNIPGSVLKKGEAISQGYTTLAEYVTPYEEGDAAVFIFKQTGEISKNIIITIRPPVPDLDSEHSRQVHPRKPDNHPPGNYSIPINVPNRKDIKLDWKEITDKLRLCGPFAGLLAKFPKL